MSASEALLRLRFMQANPTWSDKTIVERRDLAAVLDDYERLRRREAGLDSVEMRETLAFVRRVGQLRANQLADAFGISPGNANNRLRKLLDAGILSRERERGPGREYRYTVASYALGPGWPD